MLYRENPDLDEGELAKRRASLVSSVALAEIAGLIGLGDYLRLGRGEELTGGREKSSILADALEALIGAVYLSAGPDAATAFVLRLIDPLLQSMKDEQMLAHKGAAMMNDYIFTLSGVGREALRSTKASDATSPLREADPALLPPQGEAAAGERVRQNLREQGAGPVREGASGVRGVRAAGVRCRAYLVGRDGPEGGLHRDGLPM